MFRFAPDPAWERTCPICLTKHTRYDLRRFCSKACGYIYYKIVMQGTGNLDDARKAFHAAYEPIPSYQVPPVDPQGFRSRRVVRSKP